MSGSPTPLRYREALPGPELAPFVQALWWIRGRPPSDRPVPNRVLPDGCMDVILRPGVPGGEGAFVVGPMRRAVLTWHSGSVDLMGVRFRPGGILPFLPFPPGTLVDATLPLADAWGDDALRLQERLAATPGAARLALVRRALLRRLDPERRGDVAVRGASALIARSEGTVPVRALNDRLGVSRRHLERRFAEEVGLTPKTVCRIARLHRLLRVRAREPEGSWGRAAVSAGYHDQAHMNRDFRDLTGLTPTGWDAEARLRPA